MMLLEEEKERYLGLNEHGGVSGRIKSRLDFENKQIIIVNIKSFRSIKI